MYQVRTDLALEAREKFENDNVEVKGVLVKEEHPNKNIKITKVIIETENGAKIMGKPRGNYITLEAPDMADSDEDYHREISVQLANILRELMPIEKQELSVLVVGLGNREVTPDALGPRVADNIPGVMAQTGMETLEIIKGVLEETAPDYIIAVDALAARSTKRLSRTIQITDTGISPGSGVGNHRHALNRESMGIPVIAIGIPTVVDAVTIVSDTMNNLVSAMETTRKLEEIGKSISQLEEAEKHELIRELLSPHLNAMFVTPKDIDESVKQLSFTISEGINMAFFP